MQYDLFNRLVDAPQEKIAWSFSKIGTLRQCPRKYYYQYYGSKKRKALNEGSKETLIFLSKLSNKHLVSGSIIHTVIATYLKKRRDGDEWDLNRLNGWSKKLLSESILFSENLRDGISDVRLYPPDVLKEVYYSKVELSELKEEIETKIENNLTNFYESEKFDHLKSGASKHGALIERRASFSLDDSTKIDGQIDVAFKENDKTIIADWKTGKIEYQDTSLQLLTYALWMIEKEGLSLDQISIQKAYLQEDKVEELEFSEKHLFRARTRILQDVEIMRGLHEFGNEAISDAFTKCNQQKICDLCPFQEVCQN